jgi:hypothetical protein
MLLKKVGGIKVWTSSGNFLNELSGKVAGVNITRNTNFGGLQAPYHAVLNLLVKVTKCWSLLMECQ